MENEIYKENRLFSGENMHPVTQAICLSGLGTEKSITCNVGDRMVIIRPAAMTAMDIILCLNNMQEFAKQLLTCLEENCDTCNTCHDCDLHGGGFFEKVTVSPHLLQLADIPPSAKLCAEVDAEEGIITISESAATNILSDIPEPVRDILRNAGICFSGLEAALAEGDVIYGFV